MPDRAPLVSRATSREVNQATRLDLTIKAIDVEELMEEYRHTTAAAPRRHARGKGYFVPHTGTVNGPTNRLEEHLAIALVNDGVRLSFGDHAIDLIDYQVPLKAAQSDPGVGKVDVVGHDNVDRSLWAIELKHATPPGRSDTPLRTLLEVLSYGAVLDANAEAIRRDLSSSFGLSMSPHVDLMVAANTAYWEAWCSLAAAGDWLPALTGLVDTLEKLLDRRIRLVDIGHVDPVVENGRPTVEGEVTPRPVPSL